MKWKEEHIKFIRGLHDKYVFSAITEKFNKKFGTDVSQKALERAWEMKKNKEWPKHKTRDDYTSLHDSNEIDGVLFVTAATPYADILPGALKTLEKFKAYNNAKIKVLPMREHQRPLQKQDYHYHKDLEPLIADTPTHWNVNEFLTVADIKINPQQTNPITGLWRLCGRERKRSFLIAHTKQMCELVPTSLEGTPRMLHTTGAITVPDYRMDERVGQIAESDHILGGVIIYLSGKNFYPVQVQFDKTGGFYDPFGNYYSKKGVIPANSPDAIKFGDHHVGSTNQDARSAAVRIAKFLKPKKLFLEDFSDGITVNHHMERDFIERAKVKKFCPSLVEEGKWCTDELKYLKKELPGTELMITDSNHNDFINRWVRAGKYLNDPENFEIGHELALAMYRHGVNPAQWLIDRDKTLATWLDSNKDHYVAGVQMAAHGHQGKNGSKGSPKAIEYAFGNVMSAHTHSPSITHSAFVVGTLSDLRQGYNNGPSNWLHAIGIVWPNGQKQLIFIINGKSCFDAMGIFNKNPKVGRKAA